MFGFLLLAGSLLCGCGGGSGSGGGTTTTPPAQQAATPAITTTAAQNGAVIVTLADSTNGATIYYTLDGTTPTTTSQIFQAPFLVASNITVNAMAADAPAYTNSKVATQAFTPGIASGTLVWSDEFANTGGANIAPSASTWTYDTGLNCCGNNELETYCSPASNAAPCSSNNPNAYVGTDGYLHVVAMKPSAGVYTSARLKSQGLFSFMYGRIEARIKVPESQGMWPAFWMLGNNITTLSWPGCGELDIMEHIDGSNPPPFVGGTPPGYDWIAGSVHGGTTASPADGTEQYHPTGFSAAGWHTYGMIWQKGQVQYYVDDPANPYITFTTSSFPAGVWPFDVGPQFVILNLAVGGDWPGSPDLTTVFPSEMTVDYVRIYTN
jgi:beta-glucanase (GH16 family)